jgi:hypothetical protein
MEEERQQLGVYIDKSMHLSLKRKAVELETTMTDIVSELIRRFIDGEIKLEEKQPEK